jgi:prephenate dehydrogenase
MKKYCRGLNLICSHPLFGPDSYGKKSRAAEKLTWILWPLSGDRKIYRYWKSYLRKKNFTVRELSPQSHDQKAARSQGLTHLIGRVLHQQNLQPSVLSTAGYEKLLAIISQTCNDSMELFCDLQRFNPYTERMRLRLKKSFDSIAASLQKAKVSFHPQNCG